MGCDAVEHDPLLDSDAEFNTVIFEDQERLLHDRVWSGAHEEGQALSFHLAGDFPVRQSVVHFPGSV